MNAYLCKEDQAIMHMKYCYLVCLAMTHVLTRLNDTPVDALVVFVITFGTLLIHHIHTVTFGAIWDRGASKTAVADASNIIAYITLTNTFNVATASQS
jgi:hypothetical protein